MAKGIDAWFDRKDQTGDLLFRDIYDFGYGDPTPVEQAHLEAINRARANPVAEAARLGIDLFEGVLSGAISGLPVQPLVMNASLLTAARLHSRDMLANNYFAHSSLDGKSPFDRMVDAGYSYSLAGENLAFIGSTGPLNEEETVLALHENLFIDEDYPNRGHRVNILQDDFKEVGVGLIVGTYLEFTNSYMLTCDFGTPLRYAGSFVLGVVYDDVNGNEFYNIGEGIADVGITVSGVGSTVTAGAGGYGIPVTSGEYTVTATLPDGRAALKTVTVDAENEKVDFLRSDFTPSGSGTPAPTIVGAAPGMHTITVPPGELLSLKVNTTNAAGELPVYEWIFFTVEIAGEPEYPIYILIGSGWEPLTSGTDLMSLAWSPGIYPVFDLATLTMADLGLAAGDVLIFGYAYTGGGISDLKVENFVTIRVAD